MKKTSIILMVIASVMLLASCGGFTDYGTPTELVGTWNGTAAEVANVYDLSAKVTYANQTYSENSKIDYEGTWEYTDTYYPPKETVTVDVDGVTHTEYPNTNSMYTRDTVIERVIAADGSYVQTTTNKYTYEKIDAVDADTDDTDKKTTNGRLAQTARVDTNVTVETVSLSQNADGSYTEKTEATTTYKSESASTSYSSTTKNTTYETNLDEPTFCTRYGNYLGQVGFIKTKSVDPEENEYKYDRTFNLVINEDGTYTQTYTVKTTLNTDAATKTQVATASGYIIGKPSTETSSGTLTLNQTSYKLTSSGTGSWEAAEETILEDTETSTAKDYWYYITADKLRTDAFNPLTDSTYEGTILTLAE